MTVSTAVSPQSPNIGWWLTALLAVGLCVAFFFDGVENMVKNWEAEEYSHAYLIPAISAALIWQKRAALAEAGITPTWAGVFFVTLGLAAGLFGELSTIYTIIQYGFIITLFGIVLSCIGWRAVMTIWAPLLYFVFVIPLPTFLYRSLSSNMQLISSTLGVDLIRLFGISVFLEGNVIDLGIYQLQVVEACSGLRYLFPLMSFGFLLAYLYKGKAWQKILIFVSTGPITIIINSVRIAVTGIIVEYFGIETAEGFLHFFEGWVIFIFGVGLLFFGAWILARLSGRSGSLGDLLNIEWQNTAPVGGDGGNGALRLSRPYLLNLGLLVAMTAVAFILPARSEIVPDRKNFATFPMRIGVWRGQEEPIEQVYLTALKLDDYVNANYKRVEDTTPVNFYIAYYSSQRKGHSAHSPRSCIPGGGWEMMNIDTRRVDNVDGNGGSMVLNRVVIAKGTLTQIVYYWFQQRGRILTNEYGVKWMIFWDALTQNRTDGALVRLVTAVGAHEDTAEADERLAAFIRAAYDQIGAYVPGR
ncbi:MAG: VPLPA-CTERM-specific exosortase XrtD [Rhodospirillales bacterium]|nr:VPLPA-CTERM-specific exosortase XrtD [Rhodospirillales bacterium]